MIANHSGCGDCSVKRRSQLEPLAEPRVLVCIGGSGQVEHGNIPYAVGKGDVWLLPAEAGVCAFQPSQEVTLLEIAIHGS